MGFFDDVPVREPGPPRPRQAWELPAAELPGVVAAGPLLLGRTDRAAAAVTSLAAYATGFEIFVTMRIRLGPHGGDGGPGTPQDTVAARRSFRFGLLLPDGTKVIADPDRPRPGSDAEPTGPVLVPHAFGGRPGVGFSRWWAWPLPPEGPLEFVCEWPTMGIAESRAAIDARLILDAAHRSIRLWPEDEG